MADQISDAVLDAILAQDAKARVACETLITTGLVVVAGEITTSAYVDFPGIVRTTVNGIGFDNGGVGFDGNTCGVITSIDGQSPDIAQGVDTAFETRTGTAGEDAINSQGAGDQGMMFGYACNETVALKTVLISTQHNPGIDAETTIKPDLIEHVIRPSLPAEFADDDFEVYVNPTGNFVLGGPHADVGLTGRKIIVDTYGGMARHGGGAFSGKDPSKVDRSAAYAMRWVAKNIVAAGLAERCEVQVAYAIGVAHPVSVMVETFGTESIGRAKVLALINEHFDL